MTLPEIKELLAWARQNGAAQLKVMDAGGFDITFYPEKGVPEFVSRPSEDWRDRVDMEQFGTRLSVTKDRS